jgi:hypothetical protein
VEVEWSAEYVIEHSSLCFKCVYSKGGGWRVFCELYQEEVDETEKMGLGCPGFFNLLSGQLRPVQELD